MASSNFSCFVGCCYSVVAVIGLLGGLHSHSPAPTISDHGRQSIRRCSRGHSGRCVQGKDSTVGQADVATATDAVTGKRNLWLSGMVCLFSSRWWFCMCDVLCLDKLTTSHSHRFISGSPRYLSKYTPPTHLSFIPLQHPACPSSLACAIRMWLTTEWYVFFVMYCWVTVHVIHFHHISRLPL